MFIGITATRRLKNKGDRFKTTIREYVKIVVGYGGPNRPVVEAAKEASRRYSSEWEIACLQICEYTYNAALRERDCEKMLIERMTGIDFDKCWRLRK